MQTACVFVDGENFRKNIGQLFSDKFDKNEYLPKKANWEALFDYIVYESCGSEVKRLRTYWYVINEVDFFPYRLPSAKHDTNTLKHVLIKYAPHKDRIDQCTEDQLETTLQQMSDDLLEARRQFESRFEGWQVIQDGIAKKHRAVGFRRSGAIQYSLFTRQLGEEKTVDVKLACDLTELRTIYDVAVIVSGDQDFVPAVRVAKDAGRTVVNVAFKTPKGNLLPGGARRLTEQTDDSFEMPHQKLEELLGL